MKLAFVSNYLNHHQLPLCIQFQKQFEDFVFIAIDTQDIQGYQLLLNESFVIEYGKNAAKVKKIMRDYDVVIFGAALQELVDLRMLVNKLTFLYSERFYRKGVWRRFNPLTLRKLYNRIIKYKKKNYYVLCASAYLPYDLSLLTFPTRKCYRWGYFPEGKSYDVNNLMKNKDTKHILWCSRFLELKHPEAAIMVAKRLKDNNIDFHMSLIGSGEQEDTIKKMVKDEDLSSEISFLGSMSQEMVRKHMEKSGIFMFTSDFHEGWGAVVNEAMNSGCAVVASHAAGSVPFLVQNDINGFIYQSGNINDLYDKVSTILLDNEKQRKIGEEAYQTIKNYWNPEIAALRLKQLVNEILLEENTSELFEMGPCSSAVLIKNSWMKR